MGKFYVRALYKYHPTQPDEIELHANDVLLVTDVLDDNWYIGGNLKESSGHFPISYVEHLSLQRIENHEKLFAAINNFSGSEPEDLTFSEGDIIKGLNAVSGSRWNGVVVGNSEVSSTPGIFPLTHVVELAQNCCSAVVNNEFQNSNDHVVNNNNNNEGNHKTTLKRDPIFNVDRPVIGPRLEKLKKGHKRSGSWYTEDNTKSTDSFVKPYAKTLYPYEAAGPDELSFVDKEIIFLTKHYPGGWSEGKIDGKVGFFPMNYVDVIVDCSPSMREVDAAEEEKKKRDYQISKRSNHSEGGDDDDVELYGRALYDFSASSSEQIDLKEGDTVTILKKAHEAWYKARHDDGRIGFCPVSYIEVFGAEPELSSPDGNCATIASETVGESNSEPLLSPTKPVIKPKPVGNVMHEKSSIKHSTTTSTPKKPNITNATQNNFSSPIIKSDVKRAPIPPSRRESVGVNVQDTAKLIAQQLSASKIKTGADEGRRSQGRGDKHFPKSSSSNSITKSRPPPLPDVMTPAALATTNVTMTSPTNTVLPSRLTPSRSVPTRPVPPQPSTLNKNSPENLIQFSPEHDPSKKPAMRPKPPTPGSVTTPTEISKSDKRSMVIDELLKTEGDYSTSLEFCKTTFREVERLHGCSSGLDIDALFGNTEEILELSNKLLDLLNGCSGSSTQHRNIGQCFLRLEEDFKRVYAPYCRNHDNVIALLEKYETDRDTQTHFRRVIEIMKERFVVFDVASILIKPVQRILKYPLLLSELNKCTDENSAEKESIASAMQCMANIASYINEFKRKQDLVSKYKQETDEKFMDKIQKLSMHSTRKKLMRISQMIVGVQTVHEDFKREEQTFRNLEILLKNLIRDFNSLIVTSQESAFAVSDLAEEIYGCYDEVAMELDIYILREVYERVSKLIFTEFRVKIEVEIIPALNSLLVMFKGPSKVVKKRHDKLLDYENSTRLSNSVDPESREEQNIAKTNYEALNSQLLDELPRLNKLSFEIIFLLLQHFLKIKNTYHKDVAMQMKKLLSLKFMNSENQDSRLNLSEQFNIGHAAVVDVLSHLSFIPSNFNPNASEIKKHRRLTMDDSLFVKLNYNPAQGEAGVYKLLQTYPPEKLFKVIKYFVGYQAMDVTLPEGSVVAVLKEVDPMGNRERWYIDDSSSTGFVLKSYLEPYKEVSKEISCNRISLPPSSSSSSNNLLDHLDNDYTLKPIPPPRTTTTTTTMLSPTAVLQSQLPALFAQTNCSPCLPPSFHRNFQSPPPHLLPRKASTPQLSPYLKSGSLSAISPNPGSSPLSSSPLLSHAGVLYSPSSPSSSSSSPIPVTRQHASAKNKKKVMALFDFTARSELEVTISKRQVYTLVETHDITGNKEWWFLADEETGRTGYVPANYVTIVQS